MMPFKLRYDGGERPWKLVNADTGRVVSSSVNLRQAEALMIDRVIAQPDAKTSNRLLTRSLSSSRLRMK